jgi:carboxyl-terminal processing protease
MMSKNKKIVGLVLLVVSMFSFGFMSGKLWNGNLRITDASVSKSVNFDLFWEVWNSLSDRYVDEDKVDEQEMFYGAIKGVVDSFGDSATLYLTPEETQLFNDNSAGKYFEGIGAELGYNESNQIQVISPIDGSPAKEAGLRPGDLIIEIDGDDIKPDENIYDVVLRIRGEAGTDVTLTIIRDGELEALEITVTRGAITVPSMELREVEGNDEYIIMDVGRFTDSSYELWTSNWDELVEDAKDSGAKKIILDLRGNSGGFFDAAVYAAEDFLEIGDVVSYQEDRTGARESYKVRREGKLKDIPVVILVDNGSASAAEILAGALQLNDRAKVVGENTYGKGTAQTVITFGDGSSLHLTILKWLLPDGEWLNRENPIEPDYIVEFDQDAFQKGEDPQLDKALEILK